MSLSGDGAHPRLVAPPVRGVLRLFDLHLDPRDAVGLATVAVGVVPAKALCSLIGSTQVGRLIASHHAMAVTAGVFVLADLKVGFPRVAPFLATLAVGALALGVIAPVQKNLVITRLYGGAISSASSLQSVGKAAVPVVMNSVLAAQRHDAVFVALAAAGLPGAVLLVVWRLTADIEALR